MSDPVSHGGDAVQYATVLQIYHEPLNSGGVVVTGGWLVDVGLRVLAAAVRHHGHVKPSLSLSDPRDGTGQQRRRRGRRGAMTPEVTS